MNERKALTVDLPEDHVTLLDCYWRDHPCAAKTIQLVDDLIRTIKVFEIPSYAVTGASGAGKDTFVDSIADKKHIRFGDIMKDMAFDFGMTPHNREHYETHRADRYKPIMPHGNNAREAWIALDIIREYNPFIFVEISLEILLNNLYPPVTDTVDKSPIIFSGMRTELGLDVASEIANRTFRIKRTDHELPKNTNTTLDELQVLYPVDHIIYNSGTEDELKELGRMYLK